MKTLIALFTWVLVGQASLLAQAAPQPPAASPRPAAKKAPGTQAGAATQVEIDCGTHKWRRDTSALIIEIGMGDGTVQSSCFSGHFSGRKAGERADGMTFVIAEPGNRVAGARGES